MTKVIILHGFADLQVSWYTYMILKTLRRVHIFSLWQALVVEESTRTFIKQALEIVTSFFASYLQCSTSFTTRPVTSVIYI